MKVVLDTNILLQAIAHSSRFRPIWKAFLNESFDLFVTSPILLEYEEQLARRTSAQVAFNVVSLIEEAINAHFISVYYEWNAIISDDDDNKFFDAAVAAGAHYLVTNDGHFNEAKKRYFPKINIVTGEEFLRIISMQK